MNIIQVLTGIKNWVTGKYALKSDVPTQAQKDAWNAKYDKPSTGIPRNHLTSDVQSSLNKIDNVNYDYSSKQDVISDLNTIRSGAALGATAYQKPSTGIPARDLEEGIIPDFSALYEKPQNGIPYNDLDVAIKQAVTAANTAVQPNSLNSIIERVNALENDVHNNSQSSPSSYDLSNYVTKEELQEELNSSQIDVDLSSYVTYDTLNTRLNGVYIKPESGIPFSDISTAAKNSIKSSILTGATKIVVLTQSDYNALSAKDSNTLYFIK